MLSQIRLVLSKHKLPRSFKLSTRSQMSTYFSPAYEFPPINFPIPNIDEIQNKIKRKINKYGLAIELALKPNEEPEEEIFQYASDIHVDTVDSPNKIPDIRPMSETLLLCGDIGSPKHPHTELFLKTVSGRFSRIYYVAGNHEYEYGPLFEPKRFAKFNPMVRQLCSQFKNITFLDNECAHHGDNIVIAGTTLWTNTTIRSDTRSEQISQHNKMHLNAVNFLNDTTKLFHNKKVIVMSHYVPTLKLIEPKYIAKGVHANSLFVTDLENMIKQPIHAWVCGHSHSAIVCNVNGVFCGMNAHGYPHENSSGVVKQQGFCV